MEWLEEKIVEGVQSMIVIRMRNAPALETITTVARVWILIFKRQPIVWNEIEDGWRIEEAFLSHMSESEFFPTPKDILTAMPKRKEAVMLALPRPEKKPCGKNVKDEIARCSKMSREDLKREQKSVVSQLSEDDFAKFSHTALDVLEKQKMIRRM